MSVCSNKWDNFYLRSYNGIFLFQIFDYAEIAPAQPILPPTDDESSNATSKTTPIPSPARKNSWNHEYGRNAELDKVQIPKM